MPYPHTHLTLVIILLGVTLFNVWVMAGLFPNAIPTADTTQLIVLAAIELPVLLLIYRYSRRHSRRVSF